MNKKGGYICDKFCSFLDLHFNRPVEALPYSLFEILSSCPGCVDQLVGVWSLKPKSHGFDSWSGHLPGLQFQSWSGAYERQSTDVSLSRQSFSPSLLLSLKSINMSLGKD